MTYFDGGEGAVAHADFTHPYTLALREKCLAAALAAGLPLRDGATLVGMTGMPEAALARELGLPYTAICVVVNHAAGRGDSAQQISMEGISHVLETAMDKVRALLDHVAPAFQPSTSPGHDR